MNSQQGVYEVVLLVFSWMDPESREMSNINVSWNIILKTSGGCTFVRIKNLDEMKSSKYWKQL